MAQTLTAHETEFILHWGEMGNRWGVNRTVAQIHALLFIQPTALTAESISALLNIARSNTSNSLKELERLGLIKRRHLLNDRRDYFETHSDVWELFRIITKERIEQELKPTQELLATLLSDPKFHQESPTFQTRTKDTLALLTAITTLGDQVLALSTKATKRLFNVSSGLGKFILGKKEKD